MRVKGGGERPKLPPLQLQSEKGNKARLCCYCCYCELGAVTKITKIATDSNGWESRSKNRPRLLRKHAGCYTGVSFPGGQALKWIL